MLYKLPGLLERLPLLTEGGGDILASVTEISWFAHAFTLGYRGQNITAALGNRE